MSPAAAPAGKLAVAECLSADVLILGAGPAGTATALGLLAAGIAGQVLMLDRAPARPLAIGESATPDVAGMLGRLGLETDLGKLGHRPYHGNLSLWGGGEPVADHFLRRGHPHGWHLQRASFDAWLRSEAQARGARLLRPARLLGCLPAEQGWRVLASGSGGSDAAVEVRARMLVDAGGRRAPLATGLGARSHKLDSLVALAAHAGPAPALTGLSLVEPFEEGWWYAVSLPDGRTLVALMTDRDLARSRDFHAPQAYLAAWRATRKLAELVPPPDELDAVRSVAAHSSYLDRAAGPGWIAVGDALLAFDPLTSSGIAGALNDAQAAVPAILAQLAGSQDESRRYAQRANQTFIRYLDGLRQHYRSERRWTGSPFWARRQT